MDCVSGLGKLAWGAALLKNELSHFDRAREPIDGQFEIQSQFEHHSADTDHAENRDRSRSRLYRN